MATTTHRTEKLKLSITVKTQHNIQFLPGKSKCTLLSRNLFFKRK